MNIHWEKTSDKSYEGYINGVCQYWLSMDNKGKWFVRACPTDDRFILKCLTLDAAFLASQENQSLFERVLNG